MHFFLMAFFVGQSDIRTYSKKIFLKKGGVSQWPKEQ